MPHGPSESLELLWTLLALLQRRHASPTSLRESSPTYTIESVYSSQCWGASRSLKRLPRWAMRMQYEAPCNLHAQPRRQSGVPFLIDARLLCFNRCLAIRVADFRQKPMLARVARRHHLSQPIMGVHIGLPHHAAAICAFILFFAQQVTFMHAFAHSCTHRRGTYTNVLTMSELYSSCHCVAMYAIVVLKASSLVALVSPRCCQTVHPCTYYMS